MSRRFFFFGASQKVFDCHCWETCRSCVATEWPALRELGISLLIPSGKGRRGKKVNMTYIPRPETNNNLYYLLLLLLLEFLIQAFCQLYIYIYINQTQEWLEKTRVVAVFSSPRLCFEFGLELDDVTSQKAMVPRHLGPGLGGESVWFWWFARECYQ